MAECVLTIYREITNKEARCARRHVHACMRVDDCVIGGRKHVATPPYISIFIQLNKILGIPDLGNMSTQFDLQLLALRE